MLPQLTVGNCVGKCYCSLYFINNICFYFICFYIIVTDIWLLLWCYNGSLIEMNQNYYFYIWFLLILCMVNDCVTDVVVIWSDVIDHLYYLVGLMLSQRNVYYIGFYVMKPMFKWQMLLSHGLMLLTNNCTVAGLVLSQWDLCWSWCCWPIGYQRVILQMLLAMFIDGKCYFI